MTLATKNVAANEKHRAFMLKLSDLIRDAEMGIDEVVALLANAVGSGAVLMKVELGVDYDSAMALITRNIHLGGHQAITKIKGITDEDQNKDQAEGGKFDSQKFG